MIKVLVIFCSVFALAACVTGQDQMTAKSDETFSSVDDLIDCAVALTTVEDANKIIITVMTPGAGMSFVNDIIMRRYNDCGLPPTELMSLPQEIQNTLGSGYAKRLMERFQSSRGA